MFLPFFLELKAAKVPVSLREYLSLLEGLEAGLVDYDVEGFYYLARSALVKDERHIDRFDQVFSHAFKGLEALSGETGRVVIECRRIVGLRHERRATPERFGAVVGDVEAPRMCTLRDEEKRSAGDHAEGAGHPSECIRFDQVPGQPGAPVAFPVRGFVQGAHLKPSWQLPFEIPSDWMKPKWRQLLRHTPE